MRILKGTEGEILSNAREYCAKNFIDETKLEQNEKF